MEKEIIVLTKSVKHGGFCIAGIDTSTGEWIRPVSRDIEHEGAVPLKDITYRDNNTIAIFDKIRISGLVHCPTTVQPENYRYNQTQKWVKVGESNLAEVLRIKRDYDRPDKIFYNNRKDVLSQEIEEPASLLLIKVDDPRVFIKTFDEGNPKIQLNFTYNGINYMYFKISDQEVKGRFCENGDGMYPLPNVDSIVCSLTDKYAPTGKYYKMVAQIFFA